MSAKRWKCRRVSSTDSLVFIGWYLMLLPKRCCPGRRWCFLMVLAVSPQTTGCARLRQHAFGASPWFLLMFVTLAASDKKQQAVVLPTVDLCALELLDLQPTTSCSYLCTVLEELLCVYQLLIATHPCFFLCFLFAQ